MKYGIGHLSVVPCRAEASDKSEQVTQLLLGETIKIYEQKRTWFRIKSAHDSYECWIDENQFSFISQSDFEALNQSKPTVVSDLVSVLSKPDTSEMMTVLLGSNLPCWENKTLNIANKKWQYDGLFQSTKSVLNKSKIAENAYLMINSPYQWGGRSPFGIDCSGFVQLVYKLNGIFLPRDASQQALMGQALSFIEEAEEGDLAFFDNAEGQITHVGIILSNNRIIHASGKVRIDKLDHQGIFNVEKRDYTHRLRLISKIF
ncbi:MAG: C40 family peptidase [Flavobacteriales bacterium]|nr:C40 family peptidase [Flavobacteriales bacterium]